MYLPRCPSQFITLTTVISINSDTVEVKRTCFGFVQKERDLELAARIGQSLLKQNQELTERNGMLDEQLEMAKEEV